MQAERGCQLQGHNQAKKNKSKGNSTKIIVIVVVVVVIVLVLLYVVLPMLAWSYMSDYFGGAESKYFSVPVNGYYCMGGTISVIIMNTGSDDILSEDWISVELGLHRY